MRSTLDSVAELGKETGDQHPLNLELGKKVNEKMLLFRFCASGRIYTKVK